MFIDPGAPMAASTMCGRCGGMEQLAPLRDGNNFVSHVNFRTGEPCPGEPRAPYNPPVTIDNRTRITLPEVPGVVFVEAGLHTRGTEAEIHLVEENEWRRRRVERGLPIDHLATPGAAAGE